MRNGQNMKHQKGENTGSIVLILEMNIIIIIILGSKTVIYAARRPSFTCVLRCHTISPKGKVQNLIRSNSVEGE